MDVTTDHTQFSTQPLPKYISNDNTSVGYLSASQGNSKCSKRNRLFKNERGLKQHIRNCKINSPTTAVDVQRKILDVDIIENSYEKTICRAYDEIVFWRKNIFELPKGSAGKEFIQEMTRLINLWNTKSPERKTCLTALMVMPILLLQRTSLKYKSSEIKDHLKRRLTLWKSKEIEELMSECRTIQRRIPKGNARSNNMDDLAKRFSNLMILGKVNPAIRFLDQNSCGGILPLNQETMQCLLEKHPKAQPPNDAMILHGPIPKVDKIIYDSVNADIIKSCAVKTKGSAGPSGLDADMWRKIISSYIYGTVSDDLCHAIALMTRELCSTDINDPESIIYLLACRLIPLDKQPGVRPIGIGEVLRRIIGKAVMKVIKPDVLAATGYEQLCAGQEAGCEVAVHAIRDIFESDHSQGFIQIDASDAFNSINRTLLLHNIEIIFPEIANYFFNCYCKPSRFFVTGGKEIESQEGTTQGDSIAMGMYALGLMPLLTTAVHTMTNAEITQIAFADDVTGIGEIRHLRNWWEIILTMGPYLGYHVNESKSWLATKEEYFDLAKQFFQDSAIKITANGHRHLGAIIGTADTTKK